MPASAPRRLPPAARRSQLVDVAVELFGQRAYERVRLDDVAARAGVRRGLLYHYFPQGKPDLHLAAVKESWQRLLGAVDTDPARPLGAKLEANVARLLAGAERRDPAFVVLSEAPRSGDPRVRAVAREARREWARSIALNHVGTAEPGEALLAALCGYLVYAELVVGEWRREGAITRAEAEVLVRDALPPLVRMAGALSPSRAAAGAAERPAPRRAI